LVTHNTRRLKILSEFIKTDAYRMEVTQQKKTKTNNQWKIPTGKKKKKKPLLPVGNTNRD